MKNNKSNLDEQQEQVLLKIEHNACWFSFWGLLIAIVVQIFIYGVSDCMKYVAGEWIAFMCLSIYLSIASLKKGIWDRKLKANARTNAFVSVISATICGIISTILILQEYPDKIVGCLATGVFMGVLIFTLTFIALEISRKLLNKKIHELEKEPEE